MSALHDQIQTTVNPYSQTNTVSRSTTATAINWVTMTLLGIIVLLAATLRIYNLGTESFSYDEGIMLALTSSSFERVVEDIQFGRPPFLVLLGYIWVNLFGESEIAVRSLPALAGILSIPVLFMVGRDLFNQRIGLIASAIMAVSTFHIFHSQDYRYYSLLTLMTLLSFYFLVRLLKHGKLRDFVLYVLTAALVYYTHYQGAFILLAQGLYVLAQFYKYSWRTLGIWVMSQLAILLSLVPSLWIMWQDFNSGTVEGDFNGTIGAMGNLGPLTDPPLWIPLHTLAIKFMFISIENLLNPIYLLGAASLLLIGTIFYLSWSNFRSHQTDAQQKQTSSTQDSSTQGGSILGRIWSSLKANFDNATPNKSWIVMLLLWVLVPVLVPLLISKLVAPVYLPRYTIGALPGLCLVLALLFTSLRRFVPELISLAALAIIVFPGLSDYYPREYKDQWEEAATVVTQNGAPSDMVLFVSTNNEPSTRMQHVFNVYHPVELSECVVDMGLMPDTEINTTLRDCTSDHERMWIVTRNIETDASSALEVGMLDKVSATWNIVDESRFVGTTVRLAVKE